MHLDALIRPLRRIVRRSVRVVTGLAALALAVGIGVSTPAPAAAPAPATAASAGVAAVRAVRPVATEASTATEPAPTDLPTTGTAPVVGDLTGPHPPAHQEKPAPRAPPVHDDAAR